MPRKNEIRAMVRGAYDLQKLRIQTGQRIVSNFKAKLGIQPGTKEADKKQADKILKQLRSEYSRLTDGLTRITLNLRLSGTELISDIAEVFLIRSYETILAEEGQMFKDLGKTIKSLPIYNSFLSEVRGVGPAMAGVIISEFDIHRAPYPSSLWKYAGLDVAPDGKGRSRKEAHLIEVEYTNKKGERAKRKSITFNPFLKTKLVGVLGPSFLKCGQGEKYADAYYSYKNRLQSHPVHKDKSDGQRHNMAIRYMIKLFLIDLYNEWRSLEGLPVSKPFHEDKLGIVHHKAA